MRRRDVLVAGITAGTILPQVSACEILGLQWRYRYRLTGEVQQGNQLHRGSSVIEVVRDKGYNGVGGRSRGEAAVIDIPNAGSLFLLLRDSHDGSPDWPFRMPHMAFASLLGGYTADPELLDKLVELPAGTTAVLVPDQYPTMVRFRAARDPTSVELVDPSNLEASFGPGASLRRVLIEITRDPVTRGIRDRLPWLFTRDYGSLARIPMDRPIGTLPLAYQLNDLNFAQGET